MKYNMPLHGSSLRSQERTGSSRPQIQNTVFGCKFVKEVKLFDVYEGKQIGEDKKSMAFTVRFVPDEEEFTGEMIDGYVKKILKNLKNKLEVELRS